MTGGQADVPARAHRREPGGVGGVSAVLRAAVDAVRG